MLETTHKERALEFFRSVQDALREAFDAIENSSCRMEYQPWTRSEGGGGRIGLIRGSVVEKAGANISEVWGPAYPALEGEFSGKPFWAAGVSSIAHMNNPFAPIGHLNTRLISVGETFWVGGGGDLTPFRPFEEDTRDFHEALREACEHYELGAYTRFAKQCDEYFYIPHRKSCRGVGGVFFDHIQGDFEKIFSLIQRVAWAYAGVFPKILQRRKNHPFTAEDKEAQLYWRGRYAEFNLAYDRGTRFGLMTGGNPDAIFVSLPPVVKW